MRAYCSSVISILAVYHLVLTRPSGTVPAWAARDQCSWSHSCIGSSRIGTSSATSCQLGALHSTPRQLSQRFWSSTSLYIRSVESPKDALLMSTIPAFLSSGSIDLQSHTHKCQALPSHETIKPLIPRARSS